MVTTQNVGDKILIDIHKVIDFDIRFSHVSQDISNVTD